MSLHVHYILDFVILAIIYIIIYSLLLRTGQGA